MTAAHQRLNDADLQDGKLWAAALAVAEAARAEQVAAGTEASCHALIEAEAGSEAQTGPLGAASIQRHAIRGDLDHVAQHLAAAATDRRAAATDRARTRLDRHAAPMTAALPWPTACRLASTAQASETKNYPG